MRGIDRNLTPNSPDADEKMKIKKPASKVGFSNLAPLTGSAFAINWLISKLILKALPVKTTRMTTNSCRLHKSSNK